MSDCTPRTPAPVRNIAAFIAARLTEDEAFAEACPAGPWQLDDDLEADYGATAAADVRVFGAGPPIGRAPTIFFGPSSKAYGDEELAPYHFVTRFDPARALAEIAAKWQILAQHCAVPLYNQWISKGDQRYLGTITVCRTCEPPRQLFGDTVWPCPTLRLLAAPYAQHPDYDPTWQPDSPGGIARARPIDIDVFIRARLDHEEAIARQCIPNEDHAAGHGRWSAYLEGGDDGWAVEAASGPDPGIVQHRHLAEHIATQDPDRTMAQITAMRRILTWHGRPPIHRQTDDFPHFCGGCGMYPTGEPRVEHINQCEDLRNLASIWSGHPDYNPAWSLT